MRLLGILTAVLLLASCGGGREFHKNPVDEIIKQHASEKPLAVILYDMDVEGNFSKTYKHQYKVVREKDGVPFEEQLPWVEVEEDFFWKNENNMGMELAAIDSAGKVNKVPSPAGFNNYVGNSRYGHWNNSGGSSFWVFYGQYAFMSHMFGWGRHPIYRNDYRGYRTNYYGKKAYYGSSKTGRNNYGTNSTYNKTNRKNFFARKSSRTGWNRSSSRSSSRSRSSGSRSRGGGFGK